MKGRASEGVEQQIREETVEFDHDSGGEEEPDRRKDGCRGEKFFHDLELVMTLTRSCGETQRGDTVMRSSDSVRALPVSSLKAASGQLAAAMVLFRARGTSI